MNDLGCQPTAKKTLMNAVERLTTTADRFEDLARLSKTLTAKFDRTEGNPVPERCGELKKQDSQPDIIDLFNGINNRLDDLLNQIGSNVERVVNMID